MCARYYFDEEAWDAVKSDFSEAGISAARPETGEVAPSMSALALVAGAGTVPAPAFLAWGFPSFDGRGLIINARAEGIAQKRTFAESIRQRRCVLPAAGFYEWDREKQRVGFTREGSPVIYLAGIWRPYGEDRRFVIITREANESMLPVHDRMPLIFGPGQVRDWLSAPDRTEELLATPLPGLAAQREYEQLSLF